LTFLTDSDEDNAGGEFPIEVSALVVAAADGYIL